MIDLPGGDSATPKLTQYEGKKVWGVYVAGDTFHVWTRGEVNQLHHYGIEGVIPIVVPPQNEEWWVENHGYAVLEALVREAKAWGIPKGSPLCLDVEEHQSSAMNYPSDVCHAWRIACGAHGMRSWTYGSKSFLVSDHYSHRWLAEWPIPTPVHPQLPPGFAGWQYHGEDHGIDHDIFQAGRTYLSPHLELVTLPAQEAAVTSTTKAPDAASGGGLAQPSPSPASSQQKGNQVITLSPQLKKAISDLATFVAHGGSWTILINDFVHAFTVNNKSGLATVLTGIAGSFLVGNHVVTKAKN